MSRVNPSRVKRSLVQANVRGSRGASSPTRSGRALEELLSREEPSSPVLGSSSSKLPPISSSIAVHMSPYMLFHGEPRRMWGVVPSSSSSAMDVSSGSTTASPTAGGRRGSKAATLNEEEEDLPATSPFRSGDLGAALFASAAAFTGGQAIRIIHDVVERSQQQSRLRAGGGGSDTSSSYLPQLASPAPSSTNPASTALPAANLTSIHRLLVGCAVREASKVIAKQRETFNSTGGGVSGVENRASYEQALYARAGSEIRVASFLRLLREDYDILAKPLLDALSEGLYRVNERLVEDRGVSAVLPSSKTFPAAVPGAIPIAALVELLHIYLNDAFAVATRQACFNNIDVDRTRVITMAQLRALRGLKPAALMQKTGRCGSFSMIKALLDIFQHSGTESSTQGATPCAATSTLTMEQLNPWFDIDDGRLAEGFLEEILRQIAVQEFGCSRLGLLPNP